MRLIRMTPEILDAAWAKQKEVLLNSKVGLTESSFTMNIAQTVASAVNVKPTIYVTADAWMAMTQLVQDCTDEIGWHGIVEKLDDSHYCIHNIHVYPQIVNAATVKTDEEAYTLWNMKLSDDEVNHMRFQGHSHVRMGVSPSPVDIEYYNQILKLLQDDDFYIFLVINKDWKMTWLLYDLKNNLIYEDKDLCMEVVNDKFVSYEGWSDEMMKKYLTKPTYNTINTGYITGSRDHGTTSDAKGSIYADKSEDSYDTEFWKKYRNDYVGTSLNTDTPSNKDKKKQEHRGRPIGSRNKRTRY